MEKNNRKIILILIFIFVLLLAGTNLVTYFLSRPDESPAAADEPSTIIRYNPSNDVADPDLAIIFEAIDVITDHYFSPVAKEILIEGAVKGIINSIEDPQVRFYDPEDLEEFISETRGSYSGIGVRIIEAYQDIVVFETFAGSPAERSGLAPGDRLVEADGNILTGEGINRAVELLRGPDGTLVEVLVKRPGADEPFTLSVARAEINIDTVKSEMLADGLGYIRIDSFDSNTFNEFSGKFRQMEQSGLSRGLILDLRNNPGGLVDQAVDIAKMLVPEGEIVRLVGRNEEVLNIFYSNAERKPYPIVVLINEDSASSAELLAGALQDRDAALLVGKTTYGKASVQQLAHLSGGNAILLTMARYFTPSGHDIHEHGIEPDFEVEMPEILRYYHYFFPGSLEQDDFGPDVEMLQMMLEQLGYNIRITGYFDLQTSIALSTFQEDAGLISSGIFDDKTWVVLREALDRESRVNDDQLNFAIDLFDKAGLWTVIGGNN
ncbi:MAG: S41 family peptidase [Firmicutes bacterium]|nr:S41 family peptidase [Bacillota bacterium]